MAVVKGRDFGATICDILGLKNVTDIVIKMPMDDRVIIEAKFQMTDEQGKALAAELRKYELVGRYELHEKVEQSPFPPGVEVTHYT